LELGRFESQGKRKKEKVGVVVSLEKLFLMGKVIRREACEFPLTFLILLLSRIGPRALDNGG